MAGLYGEAGIIIRQSTSPNGCPRKQSLSYPSWACSFSVARLVAFDLQLQLLELVVRRAGREVIAVELTEHRDRRHSERCESECARILGGEVDTQPYDAGQGWSVSSFAHEKLEPMPVEDDWGA